MLTKKKYNIWNLNSKFIYEITNWSYTWHYSLYKILVFFIIISESPQPTSAPTTTETNKDLWLVKNDLNNSVNGQQTHVNSIDKSKFNLCETYCLMATYVYIYFQGIFLLFLNCTLVSVLCLSYNVLQGEFFYHKD